MSSGFPGAHQSWLSPCEEDPNHTKTEGNPPVQQVHRKACNTAKGETKIYESKICTSFCVPLFTFQHEQRCFRCLGFGIYYERNLEETGTVLCENELVAQSFDFPVSKTWVDRIQKLKNPFTIRRHQTRRPPPTSQRQRRRQLATPPKSRTTLPPNQEWTTQSLPHIGPRSKTCSRLTGCSAERTRSRACSHQGVNRGGISNANNLNFISHSERKQPAQAASSTAASMSLVSSIPLM